MADYLNYDRLFFEHKLEFVTLVRCCECKWFKNHICLNIHGLIDPDDYAFCSFGVRRGD